MISLFRGLDQERFKEHHRALEGVYGHVAMAAQLDMQPPLIVNLVQSLKYRGEVHRSLAEQQVFVNALDHVLDMDIPDPTPPSLGGQIGQSPSRRAMNVSDDRSSGRRRRVADAFVELAKRSSVSMNMPGSGSKARGMSITLGMLEDGFNALRPVGRGPNPRAMRVWRLIRTREETDSASTRTPCRLTDQRKSWQIARRAEYSTVWVGSCWLCGIEQELHRSRSAQARPRRSSAEHELP